MLILLNRSMNFGHPSLHFHLKLSYLLDRRLGMGTPQVRFLWCYATILNSLPLRNLASSSPSTILLLHILNSIDKSDLEEKEKVSWNASDLAGEGNIDSMLVVEKGLRELSSLKVYSKSHFFIFIWPFSTNNSKWFHLHYLIYKYSFFYN